MTALHAPPVYRGPDRIRFRATAAELSRYERERDELMAHLAYSWLPERLRPLGREFWVLASALTATTQACPQLTTCLDRLLSARDSALRAQREQYTVRSSGDPGEDGHATT